MFPSILAPKLPILVSECGMDHQNSNILLIFGFLSVGGCGGQGCYFQPNPSAIVKCLFNITATVTYGTFFFTKKDCLSRNQSGIREALTVFFRLPSWRQLQATPPLQTSLVYAKFLFQPTLHHLQ